MDKIISIVEKKEDLNKILPESNFIITPFEEIKDILDKKNIKCELISNYITKDSNKKSLWWLKDWSDKKLLNKKNFKELITYRGISLWWFSDFWFYYHVVHKNIVQNIIHHCETIQNILEKEKPKKIIILGKESLINKVTILAAKERNIKTKIINSPIQERIKSTIDHKKPYFLESLKETKFIIRNILSKTIHKNYEPNHSNKKILFSTYTSSKQNSTDPLTGESKKQDIIFGQIIDELKDKADIKLTDIDYTPALGLRTIKENKENYIPFEHYYNKEAKKRVRQHKKILKKQWKILKNNKKFQDSLNYNGIPLWPLLKNKFKFFFLNRSPEAIKCIETSLNLIKKESPKVVFSVDETSMYSRAIIVAAKANKIPTLGIQHGMIFDESFEYLHLKNEVHPKLSAKAPFCPIADTTFVYGKYTHDILTNIGNYPKKNVKITGQPRYDFLPRINQLFKKEDVYKDFNLDPNKKLVVFTTEALEKEECGDFSNAVFKGVEELGDVNFIVKLHPREHEDFHTLSKNYKIPSKVVKDYNTFKILHACDTVIVMHSTIGLEAAMIDKPVVVVNVTGNPDVISYTDEGIAIAAYKHSDVAKTIHKTLHDKETLNKLEKGRKEFVKRHVHSTDGKATQRISEEILKLIKQ